MFYLVRHIKLLFFIPFCLFSLYTLGNNVQKDTGSLLVFDRVEIVSLNFQNLADVIKYAPFITSEFIENETKMKNGVANKGLVGVYLNDRFIFQDEPTSITLEQIAVNHLERIEIKRGFTNTYLKVNAPIAIFLYSKKIDETPVIQQFMISSSAVNDVNLAGLLSLSNYRHSVQAYAVRNFRNGYRFDNSQRAHDWAPHRNIDLGISYKFRIIEKSWLEMSLSHRNFKQQVKNNLIPLTERTIDQENKRKLTELNLSYVTPISKNHTFELYYQNQRSTSDIKSKSKDLFFQESISTPIVLMADSMKLDQYRTGFKLISNNPSMDFSTILQGEFSGINEMNFPTLETVYTGYNDVSINGSIIYTGLKKIWISSGLSYLRNNQLGWFLLPNISAVYQSADNLKLQAHWRESVAYPSIFFAQDTCCSHRTFQNYLQQYTAGKTRLLDLSFFLEEKNFQLTSGMMFFDQEQLPQRDIDSDKVLFNSDGRSRSIHTYIRPSIQNDWLSFSPIIAINGINSLRSYFNQLYFFTESGWKLGVKIPTIGLNFVSYYRWIGSRTFTTTENNDLFLKKSNPIRLLTCGITQSFFKEKFHLTMGVENILNYTTIPLNGFKIGDNEIFAPMGEEIFNRGRNFFIKLIAGNL